MSTSTLVQLQEIFREVFSDPDLIITPQTTSMDVQGWDSLNHAHMITEVELRFGVRFDADELRGLQNVAELADLINRKRSC